ncbi:MAG: transcription antitermination factor NusB [Alphaproteobacteria bacterium]|nr:transcription antitermination factor NusB [Alphaproteobacteria bacterium]
MSAEAKQSGKNFAGFRAARLVAVQVLYQGTFTDFDKEALDDFINNKMYKVEMEDLQAPDDTLLREIVGGVLSRIEDIEGLLLPRLEGKKSPELLLKSILLCGTYELLARQETDAPIIINDYMMVTEAFFEGQEKKLVNAILDSVAKAVRQ